MRKFLAKTTVLIGTVVSFCLLLIVLIWTQLFYQSSTDRKETIAAAVQRNSNLAVSLEQYAIRTIRNADAVLQLVKMEYEKNRNNIDFDVLFNKGVIDPNYFNGVVIIDSNGRIQMSDLKLQADSDFHLSHREYFSFHRFHKNELFISKPLLAQTIKKAVIVLSRRINDTNGNFAGVVAVQIEPFTFTQFYSQADLKENDIISLIAPDGITYARRTGKIESFGENISKSPLFGHVAKQPVNAYFAKDAIRGIPSYFSYRKLKDYPIIATVGSAQKDILINYYERVKRELVFGMMVTVLLMSFAFLLCNVFINRRRTFRKMKEREMRFRAIFENSHDAVIVVMANGYIETMNKAATKLFGIKSDCKRQIAFESLFRNAHPVIMLSVEDLASRNCCKEEIAFTRLDSSQFTGEMVYSSYRDIAGNDRFIVLVRDISLRKQMQQRLLTEQKRYQRKLTKQIILAQEREREKIGYELHDNVNQILTTVKLYLEMATNNPDMRDDLLPKSAHHVKNCITEIRNLSRELSAPTLGPQSLTDSLKSLIEMVESSSNLKIHFIYDDYHTHLIKDQNLAIYRIFQEQLNNIIKHAEASEVVIVLSQTQDKTQLSIWDNGKGFDVNVRRNGIGLNNILSRAKVFGGDMMIESKEGNGCELQVTLPIIIAENAAESFIPQPSSEALHV